VKRLIWYITGTGTGAGKTVVAGLLTRFCVDAGLPVAALKPICSGDRSDARCLRAASRNRLTLDETNPWHFRAEIAPLLAARRQRRKVTLVEALAHVRRIQEHFPFVLIEGAGGLLSPLGEGFAARELIVALHATPILVCPNRLGAVNEIRLVLEALPGTPSRKAQIVLISQRHPDAASRDNPRLLREFAGPGRVHLLPWLPSPKSVDRALLHRQLRRSLAVLVRNCSDAAHKF